MLEKEAERMLDPKGGAERCEMLSSRFEIALTHTTHSDCGYLHKASKSSRELKFQDGNVVLRTHTYTPR